MGRRGIAFACVLMLGCDSGAAPEAPAAEAPKAPAAEAPKAPEPAPAEEPAGPVASDPTFELKLAPAGKYVSGELARVDLTLSPRGEYHINQDYPISVELSGEGLELPKAKLAKPDAAKFGEKQALFEMPLTPKEKGEQTLTARVRFAVCTEETCVPDERTLALALAVE